MSVSLENELPVVQGVSQIVVSLDYKTIWCRLENGGYFLYRTYPTSIADRYVSEFNASVSVGRRYYAFPMGFNANCLGTCTFAPILLQALEDDLQRPNDMKYRRMKEQVISLAIFEYGMSLDVIKSIGHEISAIYKISGGNE
jgi:hypothetical protein